MARGDKSSYSGKQKRKAEHIEEGYEKRGVSKKTAAARAWATVNKQDGGAAKKGARKKSAGAKKTARKSSAKKAAATRQRHTAQKKSAGRKSAARKTAARKSAGRTRTRAS